MASADKFIGVSLYAAKQLDKFERYPGNKVGVFKAGSFVGVVYSWLVENGKIYWVIKPNYGPNILVEHKDGNFKITDEIKRIQQADTTVKKLQQEQVKKDIKGNIPYYIEKYGIWVLGAIALIALGKTAIQKRL